jgi:palmitoyltransferase
MCKFLIEHGAEINRKGGESVATPLQWAAQRCHYYTVNLLLQHGADPLITDAQGYNTLHISTFNGNVLLIALLLHQGIPVDVLDTFGHTALMWAAYKGLPQCVDLFLRWGASVHATDEQGFTALHWALVKGSPGCILKLIEYGADRFAKTQTGKTPAVTAKELNTEVAWHRALRECGFNEDGHPAVPPWPGASYFLKDKRTFVNRFLFLWPFVLLWAMLVAMSSFPVYIGVPLGLAAVYGIQWVAQQVLEYAPSDMRHFHKTVSPKSLTYRIMLTHLALVNWNLRGHSFLDWCELVDDSPFRDNTWRDRGPRPRISQPLFCRLLQSYCVFLRCQHEI